MKIGILSDTHGCWDDRYALHFADCDEIWHAGDVGDYAIIQQLQQVAPVVRAVSGNIDHGMCARMLPEQLIFDTDGVRVLLTHIGGYPSRYTPAMQRLCLQEHIGLVVCGHSHILKVMPDAKLGHLHINPGAAGYHGWQQVRTLVRVQIDAGHIHDLEVIELAKGKPSPTRP